MVAAKEDTHLSIDPICGDGYWCWYLLLPRLVGADDFGAGRRVERVRVHRALAGAALREDEREKTEQDRHTNTRKMSKMQMCWIHFCKY